MPYPLDTPQGKHDVVICSEDSIESTKEMLELISSPPAPSSKSTLASVYSYADAPSKPLSRALIVVGYADTSLSLIRKLFDDNIPCMKPSTIAVKRGDQGALDARHEANSAAFSKWVRKLHQNQQMAVLAPDKYGRCAFIQATEDTTAEGDFEGQDYAAVTHVGNVSELRDFLTQGAAPPPVETTETTGLWQPPSDDNANDAGESTGLWQPPTDDNEDASGGLWQPPSDFGQTDEAANNFSWNAESSDNPWGTSNNDANDNTENEEPSRKRSREDEFHADSGAAAADAFYSQLNRSLGTRYKSYIYHMRNFNGWVKATQIQELKAPSGKMKVLDLACGKGGDLGKWTLHKLSNYVGLDVARGSLRDAAIRARKMRDKLNNKCTFTCADLGADVPGRLKSGKHQHLQKLLTWSLQSEPRDMSSDPVFRPQRGGGIVESDTFSVVSIQFAIHYMMSTKQRARRFFRTVSELLEVGGNLIATTIDARIVVDHLMGLGLNLHDANEPATIRVGGGLCQITFAPEVLQRLFHGQNKENKESDEDLFGLEYTFTLLDGHNAEAGVGDAVNLPEWLTPVPVLTSLANEVGLELEYAQNFHEFLDRRKDPTQHGPCHNSLYKMNVLNRHGSISETEWEISRLYCAVKYRKVREPETVFADDEDDAANEEEDIDPKIKAKLMPMAMMKAKKLAGAEWGTLSSEEKANLIDVEVAKLAKN